MTPTSIDARGGSVHALGALSALALLAAICLLIVSGDMVGPHVISFNYHGKHIMPEHQQLKFTFSRPMDHESVEQGFGTYPAAEGKISWSGRTMFFTPKYIYLPNSEYTVTFSSGKDIYGNELKRTQLSFEVGTY
jgi:hypothetical protein